MTIKKILRDFIKWQIENDMLKDELTIDYEIAESYLDENRQINKLDKKDNMPIEMRKSYELHKKLGFDCK